MNLMETLSIKNLEMGFNTKKGFRQALFDISLSLKY